MALTPATFHILLALAQGERHGYAIMQDVAEQTADEIQLGPGTLYGSLKRLVDQGWIEETEKDEDGNERRRYYKLTRVGRSAAVAEAQRLAGAVRNARAINLIGPERV